MTTFSASSEARNIHIRTLLFLRHVTLLIEYSLNNKIGTLPPPSMTSISDLTM